ncbi:MAG: hypothetical protein K6A63_00955, partial [Acholeplasmatales bacterium]|nr:hypothetical protein [Acholeplasmatales bacterium]
MAIIYKTTDTGVDFKRVKEILEIAFGGRKIDDQDKIEKAFLHSQHKIYAYDDEKLIGFAKATLYIIDQLVSDIALANPISF